MGTAGRARPTDVMCVIQNDLIGRTNKLRLYQLYNNLRCTDEHTDTSQSVLRRGWFPPIVIQKLPKLLIEIHGRLSIEITLPHL